MKANFRLYDRAHDERVAAEKGRHEVVHLVILKPH